ALLGIQLASLAVQLAAMAAIATPPVLAGIAAAVGAFGIAALARVPAACSALWRDPGARLRIAAFAPVGIALGLNLVVALAPSTKHDETYYHMLVAGRIVVDGALHFYREPWEAAIWPQLSYQMAAAPLQAIGFPDAANVVSWALGALLAWFAAE